MRPRPARPPPPPPVLRRPPPPPPPPCPPQSASTPASTSSSSSSSSSSSRKGGGAVDPPTEAEALLFSEADADRDGRVTGSEAIAFFGRSRLPPRTLAAIWDAAKGVGVGGVKGDDEKGGDGEKEGLDLAQFCAALRLAAAAQQRSSRSSSSGSSVFAPLDLSAAGRSGDPLRLYDEGDGVGGGGTAPPAPLLSRRLSRVPRIGSADPDEPIQPDSPPYPAAAAAAAAAAAPLADFSAVRAATAAVASAAAAGQARSQQPAAPPPPSAAAAAAAPPSGPVALDVRLPPLRPRTSAPLRLLAAGAGCLFAAPALGGGALQWAGAASARLRPPRGSRRRPRGDAPAAGEDGDAAPAAEVAPQVLQQLDEGVGGAFDGGVGGGLGGGTLGGGAPRFPPSSSSSCSAAVPAPASPATSSLFDPQRRLLWLGHEDGRVSAFDLAPEVEDENEGDDQEEGGSGQQRTGRRRRRKTRSAPLASANPRLSWQAHRGGTAVTSLALTAQGELWTGSSRGALRAWDPSAIEEERGGGVGPSSSSSALSSPPASPPANFAPGSSFAPRRSRAATLSSTSTSSSSTTSSFSSPRGVSLAEPSPSSQQQRQQQQQQQRAAPPLALLPRQLCRPGGAKAHGGGVCAVAVSAKGGVVWTAGSRSLGLWCARSGAFLGSIEPGASSSSSTQPQQQAPSIQNAGGSPFHSSSLYSAASEGGALRAFEVQREREREREQQQQQQQLGGRVDPSHGLDADEASGDPLLAAPPPEARAALAAEQRAWAAASAGGESRSAQEVLGAIAAQGGRAAAATGRVAAKLIGRLGARIARGLGSDAGDGSSGGAGGGGISSDGAPFGFGASLLDGPSSASSSFSAAAGGSASFGHGGSRQQQQQSSPLQPPPPLPSTLSAESSNEQLQQQPATPRDASGPRSLAALPDGTIAVGSRSGRVTVYSPAGRRLWSVDLASRGGGRGAAVAMVAAGVGAAPSFRERTKREQKQRPLDLLSGDDDEGAAAAPTDEGEEGDGEDEEESRGQEKGRLWVGTADGSLSVLRASDGALLSSWPAHEGGGVVALAACGPRRVYSLAADGSLRAWSEAGSWRWQRGRRRAGAEGAPAPGSGAPRALPPAVAASRHLAVALSAATAPVAHDALVVTWNVNQSRPNRSDPRGAFAAVAELSGAADVAVFCLQEVETGGGSVALAAARELAAPASQEKGNANAQWWAQALHESLSGGAKAWGRVALRQLSGMVRSFFVVVVVDFLVSFRVFLFSLTLFFFRPLLLRNKKTSPTDRHRFRPRVSPSRARRRPHLGRRHGRARRRRQQGRRRRRLLAAPQEGRGSLRAPGAAPARRRGAVGALGGDRGGFEVRRPGRRRRRRRRGRRRRRRGGRRRRREVVWRGRLGRRRSLGLGDARGRERRRECCCCGECGSSGCERRSSCCCGFQKEERCDARRRRPAPFANELLLVLLL